MEHVIHPLTGGLTVRYAAACAGWFAFRMGRSFLSAHLLPLLINSSSTKTSSTTSKKKENDKDGGSSPATTTTTSSEQLVESKKKRAIRKAWQRNLGYLKIWLGSHAMDTAVSLLTLPGPWIVARHCPRVIIDAFAPYLSDLLFKFDRFNHALFLTYAHSNLLFSEEAAAASSSSAAAHREKLNNPYDISSPVAALDQIGVTASSMTTSTGDQSAGAINAFLWSLPSTMLSLAKLIYRARKFGMRKTNFFSTLACIAVQYVVRVPMMSFATMLPMSDAELLFAIMCCVVDKTTEAFVYYNSWPFSDRVDI